MTYSLNNVRKLFNRTPPPPPAKKSSFQTAMDTHYALKDDGLECIRYLPDMPRLIDILRLNRNAEAPGLKRLLDTHLSPQHKGFVEDRYGNRFLTIPNGNEYPRIAFTSHCDTMSTDKTSMYHPIKYNKARDILFRTNGQCLGADDGTGIWLMLNMIDAKVPGLYCFFLDEETGRQGSQWSWNNDPIRYHGIDTVISFDRMHESDIIATQRGDTCCSDEFQQALADLLSSKALKLTFGGGARGSFTDSATFMDDIPECTNVSVGYDKQHTPQETQLVHFVSKLCTTLKLMGHKMHTDLPVVRDPEDDKYPVLMPSAYGQWDFDDRYEEVDDTPDPTDALSYLASAEETYALRHGTIMDMVEFFPDAIEALVLDMGWDDDEVADYIAHTFFGVENIRSANSDTTH